MATEKDLAFVEFIVKGTDAGKIQWEPTAQPDQFTAGFRGKYNVIVDRSATPEFGQAFWIAITDTDGREIVKLWGSEVPKLPDLFRKAQRKAFNVDKAIDEIMGSEPDIKDEDIPF
jgi:hypothetical protein